MSVRLIYTHIALVCIVHHEFKKFDERDMDGCRR